MTSTTPGLSPLAVLEVRDRRRAFRSHVDLILDRADVEPDRVVITDPSRSLTAAQLRRGVRNAAIELLERGVRPGTVVALIAPISLEAVVVRYAAGLIGCATVLCPDAHDADRLNRFLTDVGADVIVYFPATAAYAEQLPPGRVATSLRIDEVNVVDEPAGPRAEFTGAEPGELAVLVASGGTTSASKASCRTFADWLRAIDAPPTPSRRQLICTPLPYIAQILLDQTLLGGGTVILLERFEPGAVLRAIEAERVTHLCLVEPRLVELADHPDVAGRDLSSLVAISHIGADAAPSLRRRLLGRLGPRLAHPYGASEAGLISLLGPDQYRADAGARLASAGRVLPGVQVRIEGPSGECVSGSGEGRIVVYSIGVARRYAGGRDSSAFRTDGWYDTGDYGHLDAHGYLYVYGRAKDRRLVDGISAFPVDVQDALCAHPDVAYAVAIPADGPRPGFDAAVVLRTGASITLDELRAGVASRPGSARGLGALARVVRIVAVDRIPVTEQGKPDRTALRQLLDDRS